MVGPTSAGPSLPDFPAPLASADGLVNPGSLFLGEEQHQALNLLPQNSDVPPLGQLLPPVSVSAFLLPISLIPLHFHLPLARFLKYRLLLLFYTVPSSVAADLVWLFLLPPRFSAPSTLTSS